MKTVLISGGGIAGPALAFWLRRFGFAPTVVEIAPGPRPGGQTVDLRGVSRVVAERMGVMPAIAERKMHERGLEYVRADGRRSAVMHAELMDGAGPVAEIEILRGDLAAILTEATAEVEYVYGDSITQLHQDTTGVDVTLASGTQRRFDLVIGADGVHSRVRRLAFGPEEEFVQHLGGYTSYFTVETPEPLDHWFKVYTAPRGRWVGLRPDHDPRFARALLSFRSPVISYDRRDVAAQKQLVREQFAGLGWHTSQILNQLDKADDFYLDSTSRVVVPQWSRGRIALVGDAGYCGSPMAGHGTALSLVGAYVLAGELAAVDGDHVRAFPAYQARMQAYADQRMELPPGGIKMAMPMSSFGIRYRDFVLRAMTSRLMAGALTKMTLAKPDAIDLPEYSVERGHPLRVATEQAQ
ncbi:FAD-dependent monooxygenase [Kribbella sp. NPDC051586]|uniref:FAD-dependent monooxygenase n=1 Tax=Kribbella sp. NPDC051586 TaxID=3364118 RepID=UPI0037996CFC